MDKLIVNIAKDFSTTPGPRFKWEGENSGELFRETVLKDKFHEAVRNNFKIEVNLDGTAGFGTSFLEEAFGGLARLEGIKSVQNHLTIVSKDEPYLVEDVTHYIANANKAKSFTAA